MSLIFPISTHKMTILPHSKF